MINLLEIKNLTVGYKNLENKNSSTTIAVDNFSTFIKKGEIYALAGESGCGKSTLSKAIVNLIKPISGEIIFDNKNILEFDNKNIKDYCKNVQMVFQNPYSSLNPKMKIKDILQEPLDINTNYSKEKKINIIKQIIEDVGMSNSCLDLYPHQFSGGQRQRIAIARALVLNPKLLIADEPVSALDASIQAQIINLLKELRVQKNITILFVSHDLNVIRYLADRVGIMNKGKLVEENYTNLIFTNPKDEYTKKLLYAAPKLIN